MTFLVRYSTVLVAMVLSVAGGPSSARAEHWEWQNPLPQGNNLRDVQFSDANHGYAVGDGESILATEDGGSSWHLRHTGSPERDFLKLQMLDGQTGWVLSTQSYPTVDNWIYKTTDGWQNWSPVFRSTDGVHTMHWIDDDTGWVGTQTGLQATVDGGQSWNVVLIGVPIESVFFLNGLEGWCSSNGTVYRTSDGGGTWQSVEVTSIWGAIDKIQFLTPLDGWLIEWESGFNYEAGRVFHSNDGGASWTEQLTVGGSFGPYVHFADIDMIDTQTGFVIAGDGEVFRTANGGNVWTSISAVEHPLAVDFTDAATGWCTGYSGTINITLDGGATWQNQHGGQVISVEDLKGGLQFVDGQVGFATGLYSLLRTTNGGTSWQQVPIDPSPITGGSLSASYFLDENRGWLAWSKGAGWGALLYTDDGGQTVSVVLDDIYHCFEIAFVNENVGWAVGYRLYTTTDGGQSWVEHVLPSRDQFVSVSFVDPLEAWLGGYTGDILHTTDGGQSWESQNVGQLSYIRKVIFRDSQLGIAVGHFDPDGLVFRTVDGGENWDKVLTVPNARLFDGALTFDHYVYVVGDEFDWPSNTSHLYSSTDAGVSWEAQKNMLLANGIYNIAAVDPWRIWLMGPGGSIAYGPVGTGSGAQDAVGVGTQLMQNFPNPFNPHTTIVYRLADDQDVELVVYNVLGQRVRGWTVLSQPAGHHEVTWDGRDFNGRPAASGIYFYRLTAGDVVQTRKMILLK